MNLIIITELYHAILGAGQEPDGHQFGATAHRQEEDGTAKATGQSAVRHGHGYGHGHDDEWRRQLAKQQFRRPAATYEPQLHAK